MRIAKELHGSQFMRFFTRKVMLVESSRLQGYDKILEDLFAKKFKYKYFDVCPLTFTRDGRCIRLVCDEVEKRHRYLQLIRKPDEPEVLPAKKSVQYINLYDRYD